MIDYANAVLFTLAALLPIVNPLGSAPIFLSMTADLPATARRKLAIVVARYAFLLLTAAMLIGTYVLRIFGVSLPIVRVAGGLLVTANGWRLLNDDGAERARPGAVEAWEREVERRAFYPLTFPLTVGPGSVSIAITLGAKAQAKGASTATELLADLLGAVDRVADRVSQLPLRVTADRLPWRDRHRRLSAAVLVHPVVHRRRDHLERPGGAGAAAAGTLKQRQRKNREAR